MKIVLSPAKSLDFETPLPTSKTSQINFLEEAQKINKVLKKKSVKSLSKLMHLSEALAQLNFDRNQQWDIPFNPNNSRPAVYAFNGDVYKGLDIYTLPEEKIEALQKKVRILSGLYGLLKPLDLIQPYRLEMGTKMAIGTSKNLYQFWQKKVTQFLNDEMEEGEVLVNLASNEYFKVLSLKTFKNTIITPTFKEYKNGDYKVISFFAKEARGLMARFILDQDITQVNHLKQFNIAGYQYQESLSSSTELVFTR